VSAWDEELAATAAGAVAEAEAEPLPDADAAARELAKLSPTEYDRHRQSEADRLSIRVSTLDTEVERHRNSASDADEPPMFPKDDPWPNPVDGGALLNGLCAALDRHVRFVSDEARDAVALWIVLAHLHDAAMISPILAIESPEKRCGKTTLLSTLALLVPRALPAVNASPSVLFRAIESFAPTLLIDEADTFIKDNDDLRGILNGGHNRLTAYILRNVEMGGDYQPRRFRVWSPKVIALIGELPDTLQDRAIVIPMRRKLPDEAVERFRADRIDWADGLRRQAAKWASDNLNRVKDADPEIPDELHDRAADNWRTMLTLADLVGWGTRARRSALVISGDLSSEETPGVMLLADIREILHPDQDRTLDTISPRELAEQLVGLEDRPWAEWRRGRPLSDRSIGRMLAPFGIKSARTHYGRQFHRSHFTDAWRHYLQRRWWESNVTNDTGLKRKRKSEAQTARIAPVHVVFNPEKHNENNDVSFVTTETPEETGNRDEFEERAAILEHDAGLTRAEAEAAAAAEFSNQNNGE